MDIRTNHALLAGVIAAGLVLVAAAGTALYRIYTPAGEPSPYANLPVVNLGGTVTAVTASSVEFSILQADGTSKAAEATIVESTKLFRMVLKDEQTYAKEMQDYERIATASTTAPLPYREQPITLAEIKVRDVILVKVPEGTKIGQLSIQAVSIAVLP